MSTSYRFGVSLFVLSAAFAVSPANAAVVIGNWENNTDGWIDWSGGQQPIAAPKFTYATTGVTLGSTSLQLTHAGWNQNLAIKLQDNGHIPAFMSNTHFSIDVSVPPSGAPSGWSQIWELAINSPAGWQPQQPVPAHTFGFPNGNVQTVTLTYDYSALLASLPPTPGWVEFIFATNNDNTHTTFYFDNARLHLIPEPASLGLLGLAATGLLFRRRR